MSLTARKKQKSSAVSSLKAHSDKSGDDLCFDISTSPRPSCQAAMFPEEEGLSASVFLLEQWGKPVRIVCRFSRTEESTFDS